MSFLWSEQTAISFLYNIYLLAFITDMESAYSEVRTELLRISLGNLSVKGLIIEQSTGFLSVNISTSLHLSYDKTGTFYRLV